MKKVDFSLFYRHKKIILNKYFFTLMNSYEKYMPKAK